MVEVFRNLEIRGPHNKLDKFISELDKALPKKNWKRDKAREQKIKGFGSIGYQIAYLLASDQKRPTVNLFLWRRDNEAFVVSNVVPEEPGQLTYSEYNDCIESFRNIATPVVKKLDLKIKVTDNHYDVLEELGPKARRALEVFETSANIGSLHPLDEDRWMQFLICAYKEKTNLSSELLARWFLEEKNWPEYQASRLASQYNFSFELLKKFDKG